MEPCPNLLNQILDVLLRFRVYKYTAYGDIRGTYHMIKLNQEDKKWIKFLWRRDDGEAQALHLQFTSPVRALVSSLPPQRMLPALVRLTEDKKLGKNLRRTTYADLFSLKSLHSAGAAEFLNAARAAMSSVGMELRTPSEVPKIL